MSDILELGKAVNEKCQSKDGSVDHRYWAFRSVELLPALIAEVERLRSDVNHWKLIAGEKHDDMISWMNECKKKDARIKELEAEREAMLGAMEKMTSIAVKLPEMVAHQKRLEAAFLKAEKANLMHHMDADYADENAREALERIKNESVPRK